MKTGLKIVAALSVALLVRQAPAQSGGPYQITQSAIAGGGATAGTGGSYSLGGTVGQSSAGPLTPSGSYTMFGGFWLPPDLAPTAALVTVSGRVLTADGRGIRNAVILLVGTDGTSREIRSGSLGNFRFDDVPVGTVHMISIESRRYRFSDPTRVVVADSDISGIVFSADAIDRFQ
jgi:hypothetical protein